MGRVDRMLYYVLKAFVGVQETCGMVLALI
jgi:hypothetical protein